MIDLNIESEKSLFCRMFGCLHLLDEDKYKYVLDLEMVFMRAFRCWNFEIILMMNESWFCLVRHTSTCPSSLILIRAFRCWSFEIVLMMNESSFCLVRRTSTCPLRLLLMSADRCSNFEIVLMMEWIDQAYNMSFTFLIKCLSKDLIVIGRWRELE